MNLPLWIYILILVSLMLIVFVELYFIVKRILLNYEFQKQKIKDKKYASTLYRFYIYSKYHSKDTITDFISDFESFYQDESTQEFNINRTIGFSHDVSALNYKKQLNSSNSPFANMQQDVSNTQEQQSSTIVNNQAGQQEEKEITNKSSSNINIKVASSKNNSSSSKKANEAFEKKQEKINKKDSKKDSKKDKKDKTDSPVYFNEDKPTAKEKVSKKETKSAAKDKKEKESLKKLMSDI